MKRKMKKEKKVVCLLALIGIILIIAYEVWEQTSEKGWKRGTSQFHE